MQLPRPVTAALAALRRGAGAAEAAPAPGEAGRVAVLERQVAASDAQVAHLEESIAELERALLDPGWTRLATQAELEFSYDGMLRLRATCRLFGIKNPLIKRGLGLRSAYVWGQGVEITARANGTGHDGEQDVQAVVNQFLADPGNKRAFTGAEARHQLEFFGLGCEGNVFLACFTKPASGQVQVRTIPPDEIADIITNPDDVTEPWYYLRRWSPAALDPRVGVTGTATMERLYPALDYKPKRRPAALGEIPIAWDAPVLHVAANRPRGWKFGVPDAYAAIDWANAYRDFLTDWARLMRALARYAWKVKTPASAASTVRSKVNTAPGRSEVTGDPMSAGATAIIGPDQALEAVGKSGASFDAESGRPLAMQVAAALGVPVTMLLADPGQTGARATAETLDRPTELEMSQRRELWGDAMQRILAHVIASAVRAGLLNGTVDLDPDGGREMLALAGDTDPTVDIFWPTLDQIDAPSLVKAIVEAAGVGVIPPEEVLRLLLTALGVRQVDKMVEAMLDDDGKFVWPESPPLGGLGAAAAGLLAAGGDPANAGPGSMQPDGEEEPADDDEPAEPEPDDEPV